MNGFGKKEKEKYIQNYFRDSPQKIQTTINLLENNNNLNSSMEIALYLEMICMMVSNESSFLQNKNIKMGEIYSNIIDQILEINIKRERFPFIKNRHMNDIGKVICIFQINFFFKTIFF
jgi:hypothetical protein